MKKKHYSEINWAVPTEEDLAYLKSLSREERTSLLLENVKANDNGKISDMSMDDIWEEALRRARSAA